jgi:hypothetical protein
VTEEVGALDTETPPPEVAVVDGSKHKRFTCDKWWCHKKVMELAEDRTASSLAG